MRNQKGKRTIWTIGVLFWIGIEGSCFAMDPLEQAEIASQQILQGFSSTDLASPPVKLLPDLESSVRILQGHADRVQSASFSPDGTQIVTASTDRTAIVWNAKTGDRIKTLEGHTDWARSASFSPDGTQIVTASYDGTAGIWKISYTQQELEEITQALTKPAESPKPSQKEDFRKRFKLPPLDFDVSHPDRSRGIQGTPMRADSEKT